MRTGEQVICGSVCSYVLAIRHYTPNTFSVIPNLSYQQILVNTVMKINFCDYSSIYARTPENIDKYSVFAYSRLSSKDWRMCGSGLRKISGRWVPHLLSSKNKLNRTVISEVLLAHIHCNLNEFWHWFLTVDETWIHHYTPEMEEQSKQWIVKGELAPKKAKTMKSASEVMATVFWGVCGIILNSYLEWRSMITGQYYASLFSIWERK